MNEITQERSEREPLARNLLLAMLMAVLVALALRDFYGVAQESGRFSLRWQAALFVFAVAGLGALGLWILSVWHWLPGWLRPFTALRARLGWLCWLVVGAALLLVVGWLQYTQWGTLLAKPSIHWLLFVECALLTG